MGKRRGTIGRDLVREAVRPAAVARLTALPALVGLALASALPGQPVPVETADLGTAPHAQMHMLLERTIFQVDVLELDVRLGAEAAGRIASLLAGSSGVAAHDALADSIAAVALGAHDVLARIEFLRDAGLDQLLEGIRENVAAARKSGLITRAQMESISSSLPGWYGFLEGRGVRSGDRMFQRVRGDTLRTVYVSAGGRRLLDQVDVGPERRLSVLGGYFAPGSAFREQLLGSLLEGE